MPRNVEIKARIEGFEDLKHRVTIITDTAPVEIVQDDSFFNCDNGRLKLRTFSENSGELIFYKRDDESGPKECFYLISKTSEPCNLREALNLAYGVIGRVQKSRTLFFKGRTRIHLDSVKGLGTFLELEVVLEEDESLENGIEEARALLSQLGVNDSQLVEGAYIDLLNQNGG